MIKIALQFIGILLFIVALDGLIVYGFWHIFLIPLGLPEISLVHAIGLATGFYYLSRHRSTYFEIDPTRQLIYDIIIRPCLFIVAGVLLWLIL